MLFDPERQYNINKMQLNASPAHRIGASKRSAYLIFAVVAVPFLMSSIDSTVVVVSLPAMVDEMETNLAWVGWVITGYLLSQTIIMPVAGKLSDDFGRKRVFLASVLLFTLTSLAAGLAPNIYWLIIFRVLQGIGGGAFMPIATGIVSDAFGDRRAAAIGLFGSIFPIGAILGPNIGGFIVDHFSWRWIFFVNIPIGIAATLFGLAVLRRTEPGPARRFDVAGAGIFSAAMSAILYALTTWADNPESVGFLTWSFFAIGAILLVVLVKYETRVETPIIDMRLLRWRPFIGVNIYNFFFGAVAFSFFTFIPYYTAIAYGMSASENGIILTPRSVAMMAMSALSSLFIIRFRYRPPMIIGLLILSASLFLLGLDPRDVVLLGWRVPNLLFLTLTVMLGGVGIGIANPAANNAALDLLPEKVAAVSGIRGMFRSTGGLIGTAGLVLAVSHFQDKAAGLRETFFVFGAMLVLLVLVVFMIPDSAYKRYLDAHDNHRS